MQHLAGALCSPHTPGYLSITQFIDIAHDNYSLARHGQFPYQTPEHTFVIFRRKLIDNVGFLIRQLLYCCFTYL